MWTPFIKWTISLVHGPKISIVMIFTLITNPYLADTLSVSGHLERS